MMLRTGIASILLALPPRMAAIPGVAAYHQLPLHLTDLLEFRQ
jgi:hypothetical protein